MLKKRNEIKQNIMQMYFKGGPLVHMEAQAIFVLISRTNLIFGVHMGSPLLKTQIREIFNHRKNDLPKTLGPSEVEK